MNQSRPRKSAYLVLDPGHGGRDPGAVDPNSGTRESDLNLAQALTLKEYLVALGYTVGFTRTTDVFIPLAERTRMAQAQGARVFVSVHHDTPTAPGPGVYYSAHPLSRNLAERIAAVLRGAWVRPSSASRFGRLYIDDFPGPAVLVEFGPTRPVSREERIARAQAVASPIASYVQEVVV